MKKSVPVLLLSIWSIFCAGCQHFDVNHSVSASHVVTEITITRESDHITHRYTSQASMERILSYLRRLKPYGKVEGCPETLSGENYRITVTLADGRQKVYKQVAKLYFCGADQYWRQIDPDAAEELSLLFEEPDETNAVVTVPEINAYPAFCSGKCPAFPSHSPGFPGSPDSASRWPYAG